MALSYAAPTSELLRGGQEMDLIYLYMKNMHKFISYGLSLISYRNKMKLTGNLIILTQTTHPS